MAIHLRSVAVHAWTSILRIALLLLLVMFLTLSWLIGSERGRLLIIEQGVQWLNFWSVHQLLVTGVQSPSLSTWTMDKLLWQSSTGQTVEISELSIDWRWRYALQNRWWFEQLSAASVAITPSQQEQSVANEPFNIAEFWTTLPAFRVGELSIAGLTVYGTDLDPLTASVRLQTDINWGVVPLRFMLSAEDEASGNQLSLNLSNEAVDQFRLSSSFQANAGSVWAQWLNWQLPQAASGQGDVLIDYQNPQQLVVDVEQWQLPWQDNVLQIGGSVAYVYESAQWQFLPLQMALNGAQASLEGWLSADESELLVQVNQWPILPFATAVGIDDLDGVLSIDAQWLGGWLAPRANGLVAVTGQYADAPIALNLSTQATPEGVVFEPSSITMGGSRLDVDGYVDWLRNTVALRYSADIVGDAALSSLVPLSLDSREFLAQAGGQISGDMQNPLIEFDAFTSLRLLGQIAQGRLQGTVQGSQLSLANLWLETPIIQTTGAGGISLADGQWQYQATALTIDDALLDILGIKLPVAFSGQVSGPMQITGKGFQFEASGDVSLLGRWQDRPLSVRARIDRLNNRSLRLGDSQLRLADSFASVSGLIDWSQTQWDLAINHDALPLDLLPPWLPFWPEIFETLEVELTGETYLTGSWFEPVVDTTAQVAGGWFGEPIQAAVVLEPINNTLWNVQQLEVNWFNTVLNYRGELRPFDLVINGNAFVEQWDIVDLHRFNRQVLGLETPLPDTLNGDLWLDADVQGGLRDYQISGHGFVTGFYQQKFVQLSSSISNLTANGMTVEQLLARWSGNSIDMALNWQWPVDRYQLDLAAEITDSEPIRALMLALPIPTLAADVLSEWQGSGTANLSLVSQQGERTLMGELVSQGALLGEPYAIDWFGDGDLNQQFSQSVQAQWGDTFVTGNVDLVDEQWQGNLDITDLQLKQIRWFVPSLPSNLDAQSNAEIEVSGPLAAPVLSVSVDSNGTLGERQWQAQLDAEGSRQAWELSALKLNIIDGGELNLSGSGQGWQANLALEVDIPETRYWINSDQIGPGSATLEATLNGDLRQPQLSSQGRWESREWPLSLQTRITSNSDLYQFNLELISEQVERVSVMIEWPMRPLVEYLALWHSTPYRAEIDVATPLSVLDPFFLDQPSIAIDGLVVGTLTTSGTWLDPNWQGQLDWQQGRFDFISRGTIINDVSLRLIGQGDGFELAGNATDDRNGLLSLNGDWRLLPTADSLLGHNFDLTVEATNAHLVRDAFIDATVSSTLTVTGAYHDLLVSGVATVSPLNIQTETFLLDGAPQLNIVADDSRDDIERARPFYWPNGQWDVEMVANNRANLYGQGISAELAGSLEMVGSFPEPIFAGRFNVVRGTYSGLGKVFRISSGSVQIQNNQLVFELTAEYTDSNRFDGLNVTLNINGTQDELRLDLSSQPQLDQNELLAQLVFGESIENISELQALQLALLVNNLRTGNTGLDLIGTTRDLLAVDSLIVDTQTTDQGEFGFSISAGKYLNDYLYLEVEQGVGLEEGFRSSLQLQLSPNTYLELFSEDVLEQGGAEITWGIDY